MNNQDIGDMKAMSHRGLKSHVTRSHIINCLRATPSGSAPREMIQKHQLYGIRQVINQVTDDNELKEANGARVWRFEWNDGNWDKLPSECESDINLSLEPGLYVLNVFVKWEGKGDVLFGFLVQVYDPEAKITNKVSSGEIGENN